MPVRGRKLWSEFGKIALPLRSDRSRIVELLVVELQHIAGVRTVKCSEIGHPRTT
jgi:hypothetical protein